MPTLLSEFRTFIRNHRALVIVPLLLLVLGLAAIIMLFLRGSELAPMIYTIRYWSGDAGKWAA